LSLRLRLGMRDLLSALIALSLAPVWLAVRFLQMTQRIVQAFHEGIVAGTLCAETEIIHLFLEFMCVIVENWFDGPFELLDESLARLTESYE